MSPLGMSTELKRTSLWTKVSANMTRKTYFLKHVDIILFKAVTADPFANSCLFIL